MSEPKTILVVEDSPDERSFVVSVLTDAGYEVREAENGEEALRSLRERLPDLITLDMTMPERSGVSVYRALKTDDALASIPVVVVTGLASDFEQFISTRRQVPPPEGYVAKPVDHEKLLATVEELLAARA
jgi:CheY-like chemotaxis protein